MDNVSYIDAFTELKKIGAKVKWTSAGYSIRLSRSLSGKWFLCEFNGFHSESMRKYLTLESVPNLKNALVYYEKSDREIVSKGGRVFVTSKGIFRKTISQF